MRLSALLQRLDVLDVIGDCDLVVAGVQHDSRAARGTDVFVAIAGFRSDGHDHTADLEVAALVVERPVAAREGVCVVLVSSTRVALAKLASAFAGDPGEKLRLVGVTGTNGKTTVTTIIDEALRHLGAPSGRIGTTGTVVRGVQRESALTTPGPVALQQLLADMVSEGVEFASMEVSSIGLHQHRVDGLSFDVGVFTNLSRDHLDYHGTMDEYSACKARFFKDLVPGDAILCGDDAWEQMGPSSGRWLYGRGSHCDVRVEDERRLPDGVAFHLALPGGAMDIRSPLVGSHNVLNIAAAAAVCVKLGFSFDAVAHALSLVRGVSGRLERVDGPGPLVLVDYAHTPDALDAALRAVRPWSQGAIWVVFGCGGDRDRGKRPEMGRAAQEGADCVVVTSDNPRSEEPQQIMDEILLGMSRSPTLVEIDRAVAIAFAVSQAAVGDVVLIAGKGHETTQHIGDVHHPFDDRKVAAAALEAR
jgi:UDP-N-acetylmuramoyl-L-alanyl-D-glutamate--2,6-diaminopimelate ligase